MNDNKPCCFETLIDGLAADFKGCCPAKHPLARILPWCAVSALYVIFVVFFLGVRSDLPAKLADTAFVFEVGLAAFITCSAALASAWLAVPDVREQKWVVAAPLTAAGIFVFWSAVRFVEESEGLPEMHWGHCFQDGAVVGVLPVMALIVMIRRKGATTLPRVMCAMNVLAVSGLSYIALRFTCGLDSVGHGGMIHVMPFIVLGLLMGLISRRLYRW